MTPSLPKEGEATQGEHPLTPLQYRCTPINLFAQRGPDEAPERPPAGIGILLFLNNLVARMWLYPKTLYESAEATVPVTHDYASQKKGRGVPFEISMYLGCRSIRGGGNIYTKCSGKVSAMIRGFLSGKKGNRLVNGAD